MTKSLNILIFLLILVGCGDFEFVYKTNNNNFLVTDVTDIVVVGDGSSKIHIRLKDIFGETGDFPTYKLVVNSTKNETAEVIKKDATASKFTVQYLISYDFYNLSKNCKIFYKEVHTKNSYSSKSAGYSFGTDLSKEESENQNIEKNVNEFMALLNAVPSLNKCSE